MATITKYESCSNAELLQLLNDKREYSEVIDELCKRVEANNPSICPICDGDIEEFLGDHDGS